MKNLTKKMKMAVMAGAFAVGLTTFGASADAAAAAEGYPAVEEVRAELGKEAGTIFEIGNPNVNYDKYFTGKTFLAPLANDKIGVANVTFTKGTINQWHIHHGTCQILVGESGRGYYQIWGEEPKEILPGTVVTIPEGTKHWHGAGPNNMMQHLSIMMNGEGVSTEWLEPVSDTELAKLK